MHVCASVCLFVPVFAISKLEHLFEECPLIVFVLCVYIYIDSNLSEWEEEKKSIYWLVLWCYVLTNLMC